ncbi:MULTISPECIES: insulinase family protein [Gammaproteobacteria]|uniref:insulinase family protein n=1 Tax=Gammaproteobacteria TaxID=1236 RepID=UPI000DD08DCD|nr:MULTISPECIES: insulinase family protein [Gammaproteobacteria]RTE86901.1 peptidase M16 [Aliidiomarina sp. B3213]TCZ93309.1 peptidase M16 [Lysobacter sp. N42]
MVTTNNSEAQSQEFVIEKSPSDERDYKWVTLPNGLPVLLVHQPDTPQSAASVTVKAGHFQDPPDTPGLAHFLEHMLFLGSDAYPEADAYSDFMSYSGGHHNAWTGTEHSNFYFEVPNEHFHEALKRFARILIAPQLHEDWIERERQAIESEFRLKLKDELRRLYDVHKQTSNPSHPFSKFSVGNAETLQDKPGLTIQNQLRQFHQDYYHASNMALTLVSSESIETMQGDVELLFSELPSQGVAPPEISEPLYLSDNTSQWIYVKPLKNANRLFITFGLEEINSDYLYKTTSFIAHLLGHEGESSLCAQLRHKGWILNLSAGGGASGSNFKDFTINIQLTEDGQSHIQDIIQWCFSYIRLVTAEGINAALYKDRASIVGLAYRFPEPIQAVDLASQLSVNMLHYAPEHVVSGDYRMDELNTLFAQDILARFIPENARITVVHPEVETDQHSRWYGTEFSVRNITDSEAKFYIREPEQVTFKLPSRNAFIPQRDKPLPLEGQAERYPQQVVLNEAFDYWHLQDRDFRAPKGHIYLMLKLPFANASARNYACSRIWCELGLETLNERFYDAEIAGVHINLFPQHGGITLHLTGFSCQQPKVFKEVVKALSEVRADEATFENIKHSLSSNWAAVHQTNPINHMVALLHHHVQQGAHTSKQLAESVSDLDFDHYTNLLPGLFRDAQATLLVHGDWPEDEARSMARYASSVLPITTTPSTTLSRYVRRISEGVERVSFPSSHPDHVAAFFIQGEHTALAEKANFLLLNHLVGPLFFNELRTRQQLGYLVGNSYIPMHGLPGILFYVQSPQYSPDVLEGKIVEFLQEFAEQVQHINNEEWRRATQAIAGHLENKDPSLRIRAQRLWQSITKNQADFELANTLAQEVRNAQRSDFLEFVQHRLTQGLAAISLCTIALTEPE